MGGRNRARRAAGRGRRAGRALLVLSWLLTSACGSSPITPSPPPVPLPPAPGLSCGTERWSVKTLSDADAATINLSTVQPTSIKALNQMPEHCGGAPDARTYPQEFQVYELTGTVVVVRSEDDRDYHIALADPADPSFTMVTEIADPVCQAVIISPYMFTLAATRTDFTGIIGGHSLASLTGTTLHVRGVGFYDFDHGQTGKSQSCMELHPLVSVSR
jgi:hypothetical protein